MMKATMWFPLRSPRFSLRRLRPRKRGEHSRVCWQPRFPLPLHQKQGVKKLSPEPLFQQQRGWGGETQNIGFIN